MPSTTMDRVAWGPESRHSEPAIDVCAERIIGLRRDHRPRERFDGPYAIGAAP